MSGTQARNCCNAEDLASDIPDVSTQRSHLSDARQTDQIVGGFGDKWTRPRVRIIVDDAIAACWELVGLAHPGTPPTGA